MSLFEKVSLLLAAVCGGCGRRERKRPARTVTPEEAYRKRAARRKRKAQKRARRRNRR